MSDWSNVLRDFAADHRTTVTKRVWLFRRQISLKGRWHPSIETRLVNSGTGLFKRTIVLARNVQVPVVPFSAHLERRDSNGVTLRRRGGDTVSLGDAQLDARLELRSNSPVAAAKVITALVATSFLEHGSQEAWLDVSDDNGKRTIVVGDEDPPADRAVLNRLLALSDAVASNMFSEGLSTDWLESR